MTATATEFSLIIIFISSSMATLFFMLDSVYLYSGVSLLDVYIAIMLTELMFWYIIRIITGKDDGMSEQESYGVGNAGEKTEVGINANADEIDFSGEIVNE
jgi:hypothetical protein